MGFKRVNPPESVGKPQKVAIECTLELHDARSGVGRVGLEPTTTGL